MEAGTLYWPEIRMTSKEGKRLGQVTQLNTCVTLCGNSVSEKEKEGPCLPEIYILGPNDKSSDESLEDKQAGCCSKAHCGGSDRRGDGADLTAVF